MIHVFSRNSHMPLAGKRILVVEDEAMVALLVEDELIDVGAQVLGPAASVPTALAILAEGLAEGGVDAAVLDLNLSGESAAPVADALDRGGVPFLVISAYAAGLGPRHPVPRLPKPFAPHELLVMLQKLMAPLPLRNA
ncbi:response regulator [Paeniroseomonas aquatica]|jgi:CheY-like chemotaxis protein|uniref:Response regulator n=1 Tax=Paeniroseomonas aquatica TaxID=373043 RepID=A0ABT8AH85_9PROT|nr:response regulator [Paeniroseomonas aquatica]MDN3568916.1 response regulator [Paeniroseomonas aquatica]